MVEQTVQFESISLSEVGSGTLTAFLFSGATLSATLASIIENATLKGRYTGTVDDIAAGDYRLVVKFDGYTISEPDEQVTLVLAVGTYVSGRVAALDTAGLSAINAQVVDALSVDTYAELAAPPAATSSLKDKITWLFMMLRNKVTQTALERKLFADNGSTVVGTEATTDDGTTYTKGESS